MVKLCLEQRHSTKINILCKSTWILKVTSFTKHNWKYIKSYSGLKNIVTLYEDIHNKINFIEWTKRIGLVLYAPLLVWQNTSNGNGWEPGLNYLLLVLCVWQWLFSSKFSPYFLFQFNFFFTMKSLVLHTQFNIVVPFIFDFFHPLFMRSVTKVYWTLLLSLSYCFMLKLSYRSFWFKSFR